MNNEIILSIGIITYNQPEELKRLILGVLPQMQPGVEIVINDNSDNLETESMIRHEFNNPYVRYFKNEKNMGPDGNLILATKRASGKYVWWFGDDEMKPGAIAHVLGIIKKNPEISLIWMNFYGLDQFGRLQPARNLGGDKFFKDRNQALEEISNELGFISSIIFRKDKVLNVGQENINQFIGSCFVNLYLVLHILSQEGKFYYVGDPYIICHPTPYYSSPKIKRDSYKGFEIFGVNFYRVVKNFQNKFDKKSVKKILAKNFGYVWRGTLVCWLRGYDTPKGKFKRMFKLYWNFPEFWLAAPFFLMPKFMTKFFYFIYKKVLKRKYA